MGDAKWLLPGNRKRWKGGRGSMAYDEWETDEMSDEDEEDWGEDEWGEDE